MTATARMRANGSAPNAESGRQLGDAAFRWAVARDPTLEPWRGVLAAWVVDCRYKGPPMRHAKVMLDYLLAHPDVTRDPHRFCSADYVPAVRLDAYLRQLNQNETGKTRANNGLAQFFHWWMVEGAGWVGLSGSAPGAAPLRMPVQHRPSPSAPAQTHRDALPLALIEALIRLINETDYAWPKSLREDWVGGDRKRWCPVRAVALLTKLMLPLRTSQVRFAESSEGDPVRYTPGGWVSNPPLPHRPRGRLSRGLLRRFDVNGGSFTGFYINTNKFFDRSQHNQDPGFSVPWSRPVLVDAVHQLETWQRTHNPVSEPQRWDEIDDPLILARGIDAFAGYAPAFFLFRDPLRKKRNQPLSDDRLQAFWLKALDAVEQRMKDSREADLIPIVGPLITARQNGRPTRARYDLHSLRVSLVTLLLDEGRVQPSIVSKVVGHATERMTEHYHKSKNRFVQNALATAEARMAARRDANLEDHRPESPTRPAAALLTDPMPSRLATDAPGVTCVTGWGICPVGAARCHIGGPVGPQGVHEAIPLGLERCFGCRFFLSGPAYLPGLLERFNAASTRFRREIRRYWRCEQALRDGEDADDAQATDAADRALRAVQRDLAAVQGDWVAVFRWILRVLAQLRDAHGSRQLTFVCGGNAADLAEARATAADAPALGAVLDGARIEEIGPHGLRKAERVALRWIREHQVGDAKGEGPPLVLTRAEAVLVARASTALLRRLAHAQADRALRRDALGLAPRRRAA